MRNVSYGWFKYKDLLPYTPYYCVLRATDKEGCTSYRIGQAWTNQRNFKLLWRKITVIDDADDLSEGELSFTVIVRAKEKFDRLRFETDARETAKATAAPMPLD
jgi:hypothetical protein